MFFTSKTKKDLIALLGDFPNAFAFHRIFEPHDIKALREDDAIEIARKLASPASDKQVDYLFSLLNGEAANYNGKDYRTKQELKTLPVVVVSELIDLARQR